MKLKLTSQEVIVYCEMEEETEIGITVNHCVLWNIMEQVAEIGITVSHGVPLCCIIKSPCFNMEG